MKKIVLTTFGSYGDLNPYLSLAAILLKAGYRVSIVSIDLYREKVEAIGCEFISMRPNMDELGPESDWTQKVNDSRRGAEFITKEMVIPYIEENYKILMSAAEDCDLIISHVLTFASPIVAEKKGIPWMSVILQPSTLMSAYDPPAFTFAVFIPKMKFLGPGFFNLFYKLMAKVSDHWFKPLYELREKIGLKKSSGNPLMKYFSPYGNLVLFPESFSAPQKDWPENTFQPGFPMYKDENNTVSEKVSEFLKNGEAPIVFTLGTAVVQMKSDFFRTAYKAVKNSGVRAVFLIGNNSDHINDEILNDNQICVSGYESFSNLFPKCRAIVHQCGIGTTSQALYSGKPQILIPFAHDQPDNARIVKNLGCGVIVYANNLSSENLSDAINKISINKSYQENAEKYKSLLLKENFEKELLDAVERTLENGSGVGL